jgi:hypothetical protein
MLPKPTRRREIAIRNQESNRLDVEGTLEGRQDYTIHGERYARFYFTLPDDPETIHQCQLPSDAFDAGLNVGDQVMVTFLLKTVMAIRKKV